MKPSVLLYNALTMFLLTTLAAALQDGLPPLPWGGVKPPFLMAVGVYYALLRPWPCGLAATLWCGFLWDGLAHLPAGTALAALTATAAFCAFWGRAQLPATGRSCVLVGSAATVLATLAEYAALRGSGALCAQRGSLVFGRAALAGALAIPVCALTVAVAGRLDRWALNIRTVRDADDFDWSSGRV